MWETTFPNLFRTNEHISRDYYLVLNLTNFTTTAPRESHEYLTSVRF